MTPKEYMRGVPDETISSRLEHDDFLPLHQEGAGAMSHSAAARRFGVSPSLVDVMMRGKVWKHVAVLLLLALLAPAAALADGPYPEPKKAAKPRPKPKPAPTPEPVEASPCAEVPVAVCGPSRAAECWSCADWGPTCCYQWAWNEPLALTRAPAPAPAPTPAPPPLVRVKRQGVLYDAQVWGQVAISAAADPTTEVKPGGRISVDGPIAFGSGGDPNLRLLGRLDISAQVGKTLDFTNLATFSQDAEAAVGLAYRIGRLRMGDQEITTAVLGEYGVATMLDGEVLDRYLRWYGGGVRFAESSGGALSVMYGRHEGGGEFGAGQAMLGFSFPMGFADNALVLGGDLILSFGDGHRQRDVMRVWTAVSLPGLVKAIRQ